MAVLIAFLVTVGLFFGVFWWYGRDYARISLDKKYYFLVQDCEDATASAVAGQVYLSGGAGFLLESEGKSAVVLSCYFKITDGERIQGMMSEKGVETRLLTLATQDFTLDGGSAQYKTRVEDNAETVETCARILFETANGLERTDLSQDEARAAVRGVVTTLKGLEKSNKGGFFDAWNRQLISSQRRGEEIASGILFAKDLRYLQVELCLGIVKMDELFG